MIGQRVLHYEIVEKLGEGGMGVVFKARDTHLDRFVAIKVLPPERVADPSRKARFVQEARAASALNHPNIITIYDISSDGGRDFMAMEYVAGKTLDQLTPRKGMRLSEALKISVQIADALSRAHGAGIIHRDLKPANVMVDQHGTVKVLDFGLAKLTEPVAQASTCEAQASACETATAGVNTDEGTIVGTTGYMSPEQAEGRQLDSRSDIFSFGSLLYEMVTGRRAFQGDSKLATLSAILHQEPAPLPAETPRDLEKIITRCLRKDPARRFQHMDDLKVALEELKEESDSGKLAGIPATGRKRLRRWLWAGALAAALLVAAVLVWRRREAAPPSDLRAVALTSYPGIETQPSFSPDGNKVAFVWNGEKEDNYDIYIKQIGSAGTPMRLTTSPSAESNPAWSPGDRWIAFVREQQGNAAVFLTSPLGGPERKLTEMPGAEGLSWTPDGKWLAFGARESLEEQRSIWAISVDTGERRRLTTFPTTAKATDSPLGDYSPVISPDGRALAFARQVRNYVFELYLLRLTRDLRPAGEPARVADQRYYNVSGLAWTANGLDIVYGAGSAKIQSLWRVSVSGRQTPRRLAYALPAAIQPAITGTPPRLVYNWWVYNVNLWRLDLRGGERRMLIGSTYTSAKPQYSPDGRKIALSSNRIGNSEVWTCDADGSNCQQVTAFGGPAGGGGTPRWSPDGRWLAMDSREEGWSEIYVIAADGGPPRRATNSPGFSNTRPSWSYDGRWIYITSDRGDRTEIWKMPASGGQAVQVTRSGGAAALESPDGKYIYYVKEPGPPGLFRMRAEGGEEERVLPAIRLWDSFGVTAKGVYFTADGRTIQFLDTPTGKVSTLATLDRPIVDGLCVSPDDAYVVWSQTDRNTQDLMLVENFR